MTDCVIVQPIAPSGVDLLRRAGLSVFEAPSSDLGVLRPHLATARAAITRNEGMSAEAIAAAPALRIIASHGTGTDRIDTAAAARRGIRVVNTPGTNAGAVAEHALALILACSRQIVTADRAVRDGAWDARDRVQTFEISGRCLGLVGFGHVARRLAGLARGLGMSVLVQSGHATADDLSRLGATRAESLDALLRTADVVSLHGVPDGGPLLTPERLARMRRGAVLINTARGALVDEAGLADALRRGHLAAAGLDVFASEPLPQDSILRSCPNLIMTPHVGGSGLEARDRTAIAVARKVIEGLGLTLAEEDAACSRQTR